MDNRDDIEFFDIPKAGDAKEYLKQKPFEKEKYRKKTTINGITFRGGFLWAYIKYFLWVLLLPACIIGLMEYLWNMLSEPSNKFMAALPFVIAFFAALLLTNGIISIINHKSRAFAELTWAITRAGLAVLLFRFGMIVFHVEMLPVVWRVVVCVLVLSALIASMVRINKLNHTNKFQQINTMALLGLKSTPDIVFSLHLLRTAIIPVLTISIIWIFGLSVNSVWKAIFSICGFLMVYSITQVALKCLEQSFSKKVPLWLPRIVLLLYMEMTLLFLPVFGWFLMWYFGWFPMKTWLIWVYSIYGFFALWMTLGLIISGGQKDGKI